MNMKAKLLHLFWAMFFIATTNASAQNTIVSMTTVAKNVDIRVEWKGTGEVFANATLLNNSWSSRTTITPDSEGKVVLTATGNAELTDLGCDSNWLTHLDVSKNTALKRLYCQFNMQLAHLDVSKNIALVDLHCGGNQLTDLDISKNTALTRLSIEENQLTDLDLSNNTALTYLNCFSNRLTHLDVSKNTALRELRCISNQLTDLDVSKNIALREVFCSKNQLTSLNFSGCNLLGDVWAEEQQITVSVAPGVTSFTNPIYYHKPTGEEKVVINGATYAQGEAVPISTGTTKLAFTSTAIGRDRPFSGTINIVIGGETGVSHTATSNIRVYFSQGNIVVENAPIGETIKVYNTTGVLVQTQNIASLQQQIAVPQSIYIVKIGEANFKVVSNK